MKRICIVDDDEAVRESLSVLLEACGYQAVSFSSAEDFLQRCDGEDTLCMLIDVHMPRMSGLDLLETLRARGVEVPAILITAAANFVVHARAKKQNVFGVLDKPIDGDVLLAMIEDVRKR